MRHAGATETRTGDYTQYSDPDHFNEDIEDIGSVVAFLSSKSTPIAKRFEIWTPAPDGEFLQFEWII